MRYICLHKRQEVPWWLPASTKFESTVMLLMERWTAHQSWKDFQNCCDYTREGETLRQQISTNIIPVPTPAVKWVIDSSQKTTDGASQVAAVKNPSANTADARDTGSIPGSGRSSGEGNDNPLQYSRLGNPTDRGAWWTTVHGVTKSWTGLSMHTHGT